MRIVHRISLNLDERDRRELAGFGVVVGSGFVTFEIEESHEQWSRIAEWTKARRAPDFVSTKFSKQELSAARWLELVPDWHCGYPQPNEDIFGYREVTYDLTNYCKQCGTGAIQKAPFQMKSEPKWGRNGILQVNWVFDEYFVTPDVWTSIFMPKGIECRPVTNTSGTELKTVVQLVAPAAVGIVTDGLAAERCGTCGRIKYLPVTRGFSPALVSEPAAELAKTKEYFGSGASAHKAVVVSQALARVMSESKLRGASVRPVSAQPAFLADPA